MEYNFKNNKHSREEVLQDLDKIKYAIKVIETYIMQDTRFAFQLRLEPNEDKVEGLGVLGARLEMNSENYPTFSIQPILYHHLNMYKKLFYECGKVLTESYGITPTL